MIYHPYLPKNPELGELKPLASTHFFSNSTSPWQLFNVTIQWKTDPKTKQMNEYYMSYYALEENHVQIITTWSYSTLRQLCLIHQKQVCHSVAHCMLSFVTLFSHIFLPGGFCIGRPQVHPPKCRRTSVGEHPLRMIHRVRGKLQSGYLFEIQNMTVCKGLNVSIQIPLIKMCLKPRTSPNFRWQTMIYLGEKQATSSLL